MACTFGGLDLEELGTVGNPDVQYATFEAEVSQPKGYDGGVLANFRRGSTSIKFDLTIEGTEAERVGKLNTLAGVLARGQQELVMPHMTEGFHFDAVPDMVLQPSRYIGDFVLPLTFAVPEGCAVADVPTDVTPTAGQLPTFEVNSIMPCDWVFTAEGQSFTGDSCGYVIADESYDRYIGFSVSFASVTSAHVVVSFDSKTGTASAEVNGNQAACSVTPIDGISSVEPLRPGTNRFMHAGGMPAKEITYKARLLW